MTVLLKVKVLPNIDRRIAKLKKRCTFAKNFRSVFNDKCALKNKYILFFYEKNC